MPYKSVTYWIFRKDWGARLDSAPIKARDVHTLTGAWYLARQQGAELDRFITIRPHNIDDHTPDQRQRILASYLNKLGQFARDNGFEFTHIWSRESDRVTGCREHLHVLMHVPNHLLKTFDTVVEGWVRYPEEIKVCHATYQTRFTRSHKQRNAVGYLTKNSPQAAHNSNREYRLGGPILGKRAGCSRNIDQRAQARSDARAAARRELRLPAAGAAAGERAPRSNKSVPTFPLLKRGILIYTHKMEETAAAVGKTMRSEIQNKSEYSPFLLKPSPTRGIAAPRRPYEAPGLDLSSSMREVELSQKPIPPPF